MCVCVCVCVCVTCFLKDFASFRSHRFLARRPDWRRCCRVMKSEHFDLIRHFVFCFFLHTVSGEFDTQLSPKSSLIIHEKVQLWARSVFQAHNGRTESDSQIQSGEEVWKCHLHRCDEHTNTDSPVLCAAPSLDSSSSFLFFAGAVLSLSHPASRLHIHRVKLFSPELRRHFKS